MKKWKTVSALLTVAVLGSGLTACGSNSTNSSAQNSSSKVASTSKSSETASSPQSSSSSAPEDTPVNNETVGVMAALLANPNWFKEGVNNGAMYYGTDDSNMGDDVKGFSYVTGNGDPTSYLYFKQDGNMVTIKQWTSEGADSVADGHYKTINVHLSQLKKDYYVSSDQQAEVQGYVNKLKPYSEAN